MTGVGDVLANRRVCVSFSGGRTSAYMTQKLLASAPTGRRPLVVFANTGQEHEGTLRFVRQCDEALGFETVWLEAVVDPAPGRGTQHRVVTFETASRDGRPFEDVIRKYGIPNRNFGHCTRELKERVVSSYLRGLGWRRAERAIAIGIRADEIDRMSPSAAARGLVYPLVEWGATKADVLAHWRGMPFDLEVPEHLGNCVWCWKKSLRKHLTLAIEHPAVFDFPRRMEHQYPNAGPGLRDRPRRFFRGNRTVADIFDLARRPFDHFVDHGELETSNGCSESCDAFASPEG